MQALITDNRALAPALHWLTLVAPELAPAQPGHFVMARCAPSTSHDPWGRRLLWIAQIGGGGVVMVLVEATEPGSQWLASQPAGATLDLLGPLGRQVERHETQRATLLLAQGPGIGAVLPWAMRAAAEGSEVVLLASGAPALRLPPYILPPAIEYLTGDDDVLALLETSGNRFNTPLLWADHVVATGDEALALRLATRIRRDRFNWQPGFAHFILQRPWICGVGLCGGCWHETRRGDRLLCVAGPTLDLRDIL